MNFKNTYKNCSLISLFLILTLLLLSTSVAAQTIVSVSPEKIRVEENTNLTITISNDKHSVSTKHVIFKGTKVRVRRLEGEEATVYLKDD